MKDFVCTLFPLDMKTKQTVDAEPVGLVDYEGHIEGTDLQFTKRKVVGGIAYQDHTKFLVEGDNLVDPLTDEVYKPTRSGKGFYNSRRGWFIKPYAKYIEEQE